MHRVFKEIFGRNIYESIKSIRLQKASNLFLQIDIQQFLVL